MEPALAGTTSREQRLAAAGRVAAGLLHEFRNVLNPIANLAFLIEQRADDADQVRELARRLADLAQVRGRVTERLREFMRQDAVRFPDDAVVDLSAVARETVALCRTLASSRRAAPPVSLVCEGAVALPVRGDGGELRGALLELILNALDAMPGAGSITVRSRSADGCAVVEVIDEGAGLPAGLAETAFDPFVTTKELPDAGLGLSAAWGVARRHGGDVELVAEATGATRAMLKVPLSPPDN